MRDVAVVEPEARYGQVGEKWGNVLLPPGRFRIGDLFRWKDAPPDAPVQEVMRVLGFPPDAGKCLYYYEPKDAHRRGLARPARS